MVSRALIRTKNMLSNERSTQKEKTMEPEENTVEVNVPPNSQKFITFVVAASVGYVVEELVKKGVRAGFAALKNR